MSTHLHLCRLSRRQFLRSAGAVGVAVTATTLLPASAASGASGKAMPRPIPGGIRFPDESGPLFHLFLPEPGAEPSTIFDFDGVVGIAHVGGQGTGMDEGSTERRLFFDSDMRFMQGRFRATDGRVRHGTFGFF